MRELEIREQMSIVGGTNYYFQDLTTGYWYNNDNRDRLRSKRYALKADGHKVSSIKSED
ncbi:hypothetical protein [Clostridium sp. ZBS4]|nr:hypothetical protein [Clostridium sp. ZBS4]